MVIFRPDENVALSPPTDLVRFPVDIAAGADLAGEVARRATTVLEQDRVSRVERVESRGGTMLRKTYVNSPALRWRTLLRRSRAHREFQNLRRLAAHGIPVVRALEWSEVRFLGCVTRCILLTRFVARSRNLRDALAETTRPAERRELVSRFGSLLRRLHAAELCSTTASTRNILVTGRPGRRLLSLCDQPYLVAAGPGWLGRALRKVDLYDAFFSPGRRRELSASERFRGLLLYAGSRARARVLWTKLCRRSRWAQYFARDLTRLLGALYVYESGLGGVR